jgi:predicted aspartyl protease
MAQIKLIEELPFVAVKLTANNLTVDVEQVLIDTGSAESVFQTDIVAKIGVTPSSDDPIVIMEDIGSEEAVLRKTIQSIAIENMIVQPFSIQIGSLEYGMRIDGIIGMDFLQKTGAKIDFANLTIGNAFG